MQIARSAAGWSAALAWVAIVLVFSARIASADDPASAVAPETRAASLEEIEANPDWWKPEVASPAGDLEERAARIEAHRPGASESLFSFAPPNVVARLNFRWGRVLEELALYPAAHEAYAHAIGASGGSTASWRGLARMRVRSGQFQAAEGAFLAAIDAADPDTSPSMRALLHNELGELYLLMERPTEALASLERGNEARTHGAREFALLQRARSEVESPADESIDSGLELWPEARIVGWKRDISEMLAPAVAWLPPSLRDDASELLKPAANAEVALLAMLVLGILTTLIVKLRRAGQRGDLVVALDYPAELHGLFNVHISPRKGYSKQVEAPTVASLEADASRASTRTNRYQVSREVHFTGIGAGQWWVTVEGVLRENGNAEPVATPVEERAAMVLARSNGRVDFDLRPPGCPVDVKVMWEKRPAREAAVALHGFRQQTLRYTRAGAARLRLPQGRHRIAVGSNDRVAEAEIEINGYAVRELVVDLSGSGSLVFKGCPPAVEPYMHGDIGAAAKALEREGQTQCGQLLLARANREQGKAQHAAEYFEAAGQPLEAAELHVSISNHARAAELFLQAGDPTRAGELFSTAGEWARAGEAFETAEDFANAAACYGEAGDHAKWASALDRHGEAFDAALIALKAGDREYAIRLLQQVPHADEHYGQACMKLADCYEQEGHLDLAAPKLQEALNASSGESPSLRWRLACMLEETGEFDSALSALDTLRKEHPTYPNVATRIEALRKRLSERKLDLPTEVPSGSNMTPTAFLTDQRYEVLDEIGRGGMGVVYRAHDKRLDRIVALKQLPQALRDHPRAIELFLREAQSAARLNHPNVVTVYDTDQQDGSFFITMELLEGYPLNAILDKKGKLKVNDVARLGVQTCSGLEYAHQQRIVHRDIKTGNLFFTKDRVVKIMDFGLAKMLEEVRRASTIIGGTPYYMAPEQAAGGEIDHRADLYALGVTLFQLATGELPFNEGDVTYQHRHTPAPDPRERVPELPAELAELILRLLEKDPDARPESAAEVGQRLQNLLRNKS